VNWLFAVFLVLLGAATARAFFVKNNQLRFRELTVLQGAAHLASGLSILLCLFFGLQITGPGWLTLETLILSVTWVFSMFVTGRLEGLAANEIKEKRFL